MVQDVFQLARFEVGVDRDEDAAGARDAEGGCDPLGSVTHQQRDAVAFGEPAGEQSARDV